jgi:hypothetical protein
MVASFSSHTVGFWGDITDPFFPVLRGDLDVRNIIRFFSIKNGTWNGEAL